MSEKIVQTSKEKQEETSQQISRQWKLSTSLGIMFLVIFMAITVLNTFAPDFMTFKVIGNFTVTYLYSVLLLYIASWSIVLYYVIKVTTLEGASI